MTRRRWIADRWDASTATLLDNQAAHLVRVLRAQPGMQCDIVAGEQVRRATIVSVNDSEVMLQLLEELETAASLDLAVVLSVFKFDRMEWAIEKLVELGVATITPAIVRRTEKHLAQAAVARVERWRRIALEAAKQSRRNAIPVIADPQPLRVILTPPAPGDGLRLLLTESEKQHTLLRALQPTPSSDQTRITLAVGPEGGWTLEEGSLFHEAGWTAVTMGGTILRAETAAIAAAAVAAAWLGD